jgi:hypothetical protein
MRKCLGPSIFDCHRPGPEQEYIKPRVDTPVWRLGPSCVHNHSRFRIRRTAHTTGTMLANNIGIVNIVVDQMSYTQPHKY